MLLVLSRRYYSFSSPQDVKITVMASSSTSIECRKHFRTNSKVLMTRGHRMYNSKLLVYPTHGDIVWRFVGWKRRGIVDGQSAGVGAGEMEVKSLTQHPTISRAVTLEKIDHYFREIMDVFKSENYEYLSFFFFLIELLTDFTPRIDI